MQAEHATRTTGREVTPIREVLPSGPAQREVRDAKPARRTRVEKHSGIYFREVAGRRRYEISWTDAQGRRRWRTVEGGLRDAQAALEDERRKTRRGERTAPAQAPRLRDYIDGWLERKARIRDRTRQGYECRLRVHVKPRWLGNMKVSELRVEDIARLVREMEAEGKSGSTVQSTLTALGSMLNTAVRDGLLVANPVRQLQRDERPRVSVREKRPLDSDEIARLLEAALPAYRALLATAAFAGLRQGELLGLQWSDVDFDGELIHVRRQMDRVRGYSDLKTPDSWRSVMLIPSLARILKEHLLASRFIAPSDPVFASTTGTPVAWRNAARRGMDEAVKRAGLDSVPGRRRPSMHDLRHTFASMLIAQGLDVVFVSRQLGHKDPAVTLRVYADVFDRARHTDAARAKLEAAVGTVLERNGGDKRRTAERTEAQITPLRAVSSTGGES